MSFDLNITQALELGDYPEDAPGSSRDFFDDLLEADVELDFACSSNLPTQSAPVDMTITPSTREKIASLLANRIPESTDHSTTWALNRFEAWSKAQNEQITDFTKVPLGRLNYIISRFIVEARSVSGKEYSSRTMYSIISGLNRYLKSTHTDEDCDLLSSRRFTHLRNVLDGYIKTKQVTESTPKQCKVLYSEEEGRLWSRALGHDTPRKLLTTLYFVMTKVFIMRSDEFSTFAVSCIATEKCPNGEWKITYTERKSKNHQPGLSNINKPKKTVTHYEFEDSTSFIFLFKTYLSHCKPEVQTGDVPFFQHPVMDWKDSQIWYNTKRACGKNFSSTLIKQAYSKAGIVGNFTLKSVRATSIQHLADAGFDYAAIKTRSGHYTNVAVDVYKRPEEVNRQKKLSKVLSGTYGRGYTYMMLTNTNLKWIVLVAVTIIYTVTLWLLFYYWK